ncbi:tetratricopeptide repeat protein [Pseudorhodoferax sp.]|uniref:tetratricopeptide repeat protein n=1 Tax=Pseudorhodoferax sp. TaxID=1993553 RepID=UPI0039E4A95D
MKRTLYRILPLARLLALAGAVLAGAGALAQVDPYGEVNRLVRAGKLPEAQGKADQYLADKPHDPQMRFLVSTIQSASGKPEAAIETLTALTQEFPELPEPYNNLAVLYAGQSQYEKARAALEMAVRLNPNYATAYENLGDVYAKLASQAYGRSLQIEAGNTQAEQKISALNSMLAPRAGAGRQAPGK